MLVIYSIKILYKIVKHHNVKLLGLYKSWHECIATKLETIIHRSLLSNLGNNPAEGIVYLMILT